jgi:hypothetical protein
VTALCLQHGDEDMGMKENANDEEIIRLLAQLQEFRSQRVKEQRKISELEEQLSGLLQVKENAGTNCSLYIFSALLGCNILCAILIYAFLFLYFSGVELN